MERIEDYKLYRLTNSDHELLQSFNINLDISYVLKLDGIPFADAIKSDGGRYENTYEATSKIILISTPCNYCCSMMSMPSKSISTYYKNVTNLNNSDKYNLIMIYYLPKYTIYMMTLKNILYDSFYKKLKL
jgi:hypothetical protein